MSSLTKASGGFGTVYFATKKSDNTPIAIKVIRTNDEEFANAVLEEAIAMHRLQHPNILKIYDQKINVAIDSNTGAKHFEICIMMEYAEYTFEG